MQVALQYFPCLTNPVTAALEGCDRQLEEHLKLPLDFYQLYEHTRMSYAQQIPDRSFQGQYFYPRITLPNKLFANLKHILRPSLCLGITFSCLKILLKGAIPCRRPRFRDTPGTELNLPSVRLVPGKMKPCTAEWSLGRSAKSFPPLFSFSICKMYQVSKAISAELHRWKCKSSS